MSKPKLKMIVCVGENNLIGDKVPTGNGLLWHSYGGVTILQI